MGRIRTAFVSGTILNNPLAIGDTALSAAGLAAMPTIASPDVGVLCLDPMGSTGNPEIVYVTAHTSTQTTATIARAQEGTTARAMVSGTPWTHGATILDFGTAISPGTPTLYNPLQDWWMPKMNSAINTLSGQTGTANMAYGWPMEPLLTDAQIIDIQINVTVQNGNIDVGLYTYDGTTFTRIVAIGSTACPAAAQYTADIANTTVYKGNRYYAFVAADGAIAAFTRLASSASPAITFPHFSKATSFPLPTTITGASASALGVLAIGSLTH